MGSVYALLEVGSNLIKFGRAKTPKKRFEDGRTFNRRLKRFDVIEVDDAYTSKCEKYVHNNLRTKRYSGEFFAVTPDEARAAMRDASAYFAEFAPLNDKVEALKKEQSDDRMLPPRDEEHELFSKYVQAREEQDRWTARRELLENKLKAAIGTAAGLEGLLTWKSIEVTRLDQNGLKEFDYEVYKRWAKPSMERRLQLIHDAVDDEEST